MATIKLVSYSKDGTIVFSKDGQREKFIMDAAYFYNRRFGDVPFRAWMRYAPGKAYNHAQKVGRRVKPRVDLNTLPEPTVQKMDQGSCPSCGAAPETYRDGIVPCPNCGYPNESFSFKRWFLATENCTPVNSPLC